MGILSKYFVVATTLLAAVAIGIMAQTATPQPAFEAATIKLSADCANGRGGRGGGGPSPGRLNMPCVTVRGAIQSAYGKANERLQAFGGPDWLDSDRYEITAKAEGTPPINQMYGPMLQALLQDRLKLLAHREIRELPVYALTVAKSGLKLKTTSCTPFDPNNPPRLGGPDQTPSHTCGSQSFAGRGGSVTMDGSGIAITDFAVRTLANRLDRPVIDKTGLTGQYDFHLEYSRDDNPDFPSEAVSAALEDQLGLKLSPMKAPVEVLIIDHVERPSEN